MLGRIAEMAADRGIRFNLGIWSQRPVSRYGRVMVENFPDGKAAADYCARALKQVLQACPAIAGVQFRMNIESGISESEQREYFIRQFRAIADCGRPVKIDLRYKGLRPETIQAAIDVGLDVTVSTKFWCEHMGLPYHPTEEDTHYRESRYGYGAMLYYPRKYRVTYRLWSVGSQRLLLWGDPEYAARFARSCRLGGGEGFDVFAPLTNKGFDNQPGNWRIFADKSLEHYDWKFERYWFYYLVFGRLGYNPDADASVWRNEFQQRFGNAADHIEAAYRNASQIIPLITAARLPSASEWRYWPELDAGHPIEAYRHTPSSDTAQFYAIAAWKKTDEWKAEAWDSTHAGYVQDAVNGRLEAKWTPIDVSRRLQNLSMQTLKAVERAKAAVADPDAPQFRSTELDMRVLARLARFHSQKTLAATHLEFFHVTDETGRLPVALFHMQRAADAWQKIVKLTDGVYHSNLVFGRTDWHVGHWKDRSPQVLADVDYLKSLVRKHGGRAKNFGCTQPS